MEIRSAVEAVHGESAELTLVRQEISEIGRVKARLERRQQVLVDYGVYLASLAARPQEAEPDLQTAQPASVSAEVQGTLHLVTA